MLLGRPILQKAMTRQITNPKKHTDVKMIIKANSTIEILELYYSQILMENSDGVKLPAGI